MIWSLILLQMCGVINSKHITRPFISRKKMKLVEGKTIEIEGYYTPIDIVGGYYVLSKNEVVGWGCGYGNQVKPNEIIEIIFSECHSKPGQKIKGMGTLIINSEDIYKLNYILENAKYEIVKE
jgi:hypothetical protein